MRKFCPVCGVIISNVRKHLKRNRCEKQKNSDYKKMMRRSELYARSVR